MKFGKVDAPSVIDFSLPEDHIANERFLERFPTKKEQVPIHIGCAKWNKQDLKGFYPRGTKDELTYYSNKFNCIELNATFYRIFPPEQVAKWREKTPDDFKFFPKIPQIISQFRRLKNVDAELDQYLLSISEFRDKLGMVFLQMHPTFSPKSVGDLQIFVGKWPREVPLAIELRHTDWYNDSSVADELYAMFEEYNITNIITDTAGRRDLMHMRHTSPKTFVRYTGANHESDYDRLDDWFGRLKLWISQGIQEINFFVHQNLEKESPMLSAHLIERLNSEMNYSLKNPVATNKDAGTLF